MKEGVRDIYIIAIAAIILFLCLYACTPTIPIASSDTTQKVVYREIVRDTTIFVYDSAGFAAWLECDSLGQVRIKELSDFYAGSLIDAPKIIVKDNYIKIACIIDSGAVYARIKDKYKETATEIKTTVIQRENYISGFQWFQIWAGRILAVIAFIWIGLKLYRRKKIP